MSTPNPLKDLFVDPEIEEIIEARAQEIAERGGSAARFKKDAIEAFTRIIEWPEALPFMDKGSPYRKMITKTYKSSIIYKIDPAAWVGYVVDFFLSGENVHPPGS